MSRFETLSLYIQPEYDPNDDLDLEALDSMSEDEQNASFEHARDELNAIWARLSPTQQFACRRRPGLLSCLSSRRAMRSPDLKGLEFLFSMPLKDQLRRAQRRLVALRVERSTGWVMGAVH